MLLTPEQIISRFRSLSVRRVTWENHWQEVTDFTIPTKNQITQRGSPGEKRNPQLTETTGPQSAELLAGALQGMLTNPNSMWFKLSTGIQKVDDDDEARQWLQKNSLVLMNGMNNSNFQTEIHDFYLDLVTIGTATMFVEEDDKDIFRFSTKNISEIYISENNRGMIDEVYRRFKWDARNIVRQYGLKNVGKLVQKLFKEDQSKEVNMIQAIYPLKIDPSEKIPSILSRHEFVSQVLVEEDRHIVEQKGFREQPFVVSRWVKGSNEIYGRSPSTKTLAEMKMINEMDRTMLQGAQKTINPPLQMADDGVVLPLDTSPGGLNYVRAGVPDIKPIFDNTRIDLGFDYLAERRQRIRDGFFIDQLQLREGPQMTATEVLQRTEERMRLLGPMLARQRSEFLAPLIQREFAIARRRGLIDDPPQIIADLPGELQVHYSSVIARAQRINEAQNVLRAFEFLTPLAQAKPELLDNFDVDGVVKFVARTFELPPELLHNRKDVEETRNNRAAAQQKAEQQVSNQADAEVLDLVSGAAANVAG